LVGQGHRQEEGIDYDEVFAPVARIEAIKLFLAYASFMDFIVYQMDVKMFPDGVYKVEKALYGLHQAPRACYVTLSTYLLDNGFRRGTIDKTLFIKKIKDVIILVQVYVDDIIFGFTKRLSREKMAYFSVRTNMPDIIFAMCSCSRFQVQPKVSHMHAVKRIFRYLKGQPTLSLWYPKDSPLELIAYSNSNYTGASLDRKSTTGGWQTTTGKELLNPLMAGSLPKTTLPTTLVKEVNDEVQIQALVDGKRVNIKEYSIRRILRLDDAKGTSCLTNADIFKGLARMGAKTTSWNEFSGTMASAIIYLTTNQKFNFSRYIRLSLVKNIEAGVPFFMFPRFVQLIINLQLGDMTHHKAIFHTPSLSKKVFANMKRVGTGFFREVTPLFANMLVLGHEEVGILQADAQPIPILTEPSTSKPQKKHIPKRKHTQELEVPPTKSQAEHNLPLPSPSHDPLPSGEDSLKLKELMDLRESLYVNGSF
nr:putative ribonuclease H-like domain-containing protein [Tanacetum cinerariifolium]